MYTFHATAVLLCLLVTRSSNEDELVTSIEQALEIFEAMDANTVAQKCALRVNETFAAIRARRHESQEQNNAELPNTISEGEIPAIPSLLGYLDDVNFSLDEYMADFIRPDMLQTVGSDTYAIGDSDSLGLSLV